MTAHASTAVIRQWARAQGLAVGDRGRLSPQVLDAYANSHGKRRPSAATAAETTKTRAHNAGVRVAVRPVPGATGNTRTIVARAA